MKKVEKNKYLLNEPAKYVNLDQALLRRPALKSIYGVIHVCKYEH